MKTRNLPHFRFPHRNSFFIELIIVVIVWLRVAWPFIRPGTYVYGFDTLSYTGPATKTVFEAWHQLQVPLWSDNMFGGVPFLGRLGAQGLYFPNLPFSFFSLNTALDISMAAHLLLLGVGFLVFIRSGLRLVSPAGAFVAVTVMASAFVGVKTLSFDQLVAIAWLPWILYFAEKTITQKKSIQYGAGLSISSAALILGGHPQFIYLFVGFVFVYVVSRVADTRAIFSLVPLSICALLTIGVTALQVYATYSLNSSSVMAAKKSLDSLSISAFLLPPNRAIAGVIGDPFSTMPIGVTGAGEAIAGLGFAAVLLAIVGCFSLWRRRYFYSLASLLLMALVSVPLSFGPNSAIFQFFYDFVPGFGSARVPGRSLSISLVSIVILAGYGVNFILLNHKDGLSKRLRSVIFGLAIIFLLATIATPQKFLDGFSLFYLVAGVAIFVAVLLLSTTSFGPYLFAIFLLIFGLLPSIVSQRYSPARTAQHEQPFETARSLLTDLMGNLGGLAIAMTYDRFDDPNYLVRTMRPNTNILNNIELIDGYDGGMWVQKRWVETMKSITGGVFNNNLTARSQVVFPLKSSTLGRMGVRWALIDTEVVGAGAQLSGWQGPIMTDGTVQLWENPNWKGPATLYTQSISLTSNMEAWQYMSYPELAGVALVEKENVALTCALDCTVHNPYFPKVEGIRRSFETNVAVPTLAAIHVSWSQDWQVYVNGIRSKIFPINGNQVGVALPARHNVVTYQYMPQWYQPLMALMIFSILMLFLMVAAGIRHSANRQ